MNYARMTNTNIAISLFGATDGIVRLYRKDVDFYDYDATKTMTPHE